MLKSFLRLHQLHTNIILTLSVEIVKSNTHVETQTVVIRHNVLSDEIYAIKHSFRLATLAKFHIASSCNSIEFTRYVSHSTSSTKSSIFNGVESPRHVFHVTSSARSLLAVRICYELGTAWSP